MHKDTPTEILHTILLGVVKYYWGQTVWLLEKSKDFVLFQTRLNSILADGLNIPKIQADYMCQYKGGLIGKHFKTLSQIMAFAVVDLVPPDVLEAWLILGRLTVLLWHTEIDDVESYTVSSITTTCISESSTSNRYTIRPSSKCASTTSSISPANAARAFSSPNQNSISCCTYRSSFGALDPQSFFLPSAMRLTMQFSGPVLSIAIV